MRVTCERCLRRYDVPDATVKGRKIRARCKCGARVVVQDEERAAKSLAAGSQTTGSIQRPVRWFVDITSWEPIAMDLRQLVRAFDAGRIDADTLVWRKGMPDWRRLRDVTELAERLIGDGSLAKENAAKEATARDSDAARSGEPGAEVGVSEPPPRQTERSRTPPASYTVGSNSASEPPAAAASGNGSVPAPASEAVAAKPGRSSTGFTSSSSMRAAVGPGSAPGTVSSGSGSSGSGSSGSVRPHSRRARGKTPSRPNAAIGAPSRTVTQTGLESPAEAVARNSIVPAAAGSVVSADDAARPSAAPAPNGSARRDSRTSSSTSNSAAGSGSSAGPRRVPSSDETPAQKPSSLSVPPGAMVSPTDGRPRARRLMAFAAIVLGGAVLVKAMTTSADGPSAAAHHTEGVPDPKQVEKALVPEPAKAAGAPSAAAPTLEAPRSESAPVARVEPPAPAAAAPVSVPPAAAEPRVAAQPAAAPPPVRAPVAAAPAAAVEKTRPASNTPSAASTPVQAPAPVVMESPIHAAPGAVPASAKELVAAAPAPVKPALPTPREPAPAAPPAAPAAPAATPAPAASAAASPATAATPAAASAAPAAGSPAAASPAAPAATAPAEKAPENGAAPAQPAATPPPPPARPFDLKAATAQLETAAVKAGSCGQSGTTRGTGRVSVAIEPWGRVGRVTHLNQDFVGTPVGLCVMQAFQSIQVPPFDGEARSIAGAFMVQ